MLRRLLVNHAESVRAAKRGGDALRVTLEGLPEAATGSDEDLLVIDEALNRTAELDARNADLIERLSLIHIRRGRRATRCEPRRTADGLITS